MSTIENIKLNNQNLEIVDKNARTQLSNLSTVAKTGSYNDLINKPTTPTVPEITYNVDLKSLVITTV